MKRLGDIVEQVRGVSYKPEDLHKTLNENSVVLLRAHNIKEGKLNFDDVVYVDRKKVSEKQYLTMGDILICASSGSKELVGKAAYVEQTLDMTFGAFCKVVRPKVECKKYIGHFFDSPIYRKKISNASAGANINNIRTEDIDNLTLALPSIDKQKEIIARLDKVTDLIALRKQQLTKLDELVKARFVELFGDTKSNERKWNTLPLHKVLESGSSVSYGIVQTGDDIEGGVPVFRPIDIAGGKIPQREQLKRTANDISNQYSRTLLKGYELLITVRGSVGETFRVTSEFAGCNVGRNIVPLRFDTEIVDYSFMQHFFAQEGTKRVLESMTKGIALQGLNMSEFREIDVIIPAMSLQQQFAAFVEQTDKSKLAIQKSLNELETLKKALMQEYFG